MCFFFVFFCYLYIHGCLLLVICLIQLLLYGNFVYTFPSRKVVVEDAFVFTSREDALSLFMPKHTVKRHLVQVQILENRMLQRVALYYTQVLC